ncbi:hypothetical protein EG329_003009 [Mollisiaceae sp. DMI_Dod_QoI]|nr:hypothetical protein EG329_003009 [Helotiales sp. DMI_Dod_QoI]
MSSLLGTDYSNSRHGRSKPRRDSNSSQIAKKRELDRIAQKKSRERARNRMLELEEKLERLQSDDRQKQITELLRVVDELKMENERLRATVEKIKDLVNCPGISVHDSRDHQYESPPTRSDDNIQSLLPDTSVDEVPESWDIPSIKDSPDAIELESMASLVPEIDNSCLDIPTQSVSKMYPTFDFSSSLGLTSFDSSLTCGTPGQPSRNNPSVVPDIDKWHTSNSAFIFGIDHSKKGGLEPTIANSLAAYKGILWGCDEVEEKERDHPFWLALRQVDEKVFGNWTSKAQKIAMMFVTHRMLLYRSNPCKETFERVPNFLRPRPSQETIQHPAVIDFLIWPGLRDRLVFSHKHYTSTGDFSAAFCENLHFNWPFSDDEILILDSETQRYKLSALFEEYACDLKNWTMNEGFFEKFVEMKYDIPATRRENGLEKLFDYMPLSA